MKTYYSFLILCLSFPAISVAQAPPPVYQAPAPKPAPQAAAPVAAPTVAPAPSAPAAQAATPVPPPSASPKRSAADLEKLAAPIALHPDPLVAIILPASAYPLEIVQAARFVKDTNNIPKVDAQPWDDNVKEVAKFPDLIAKMDADISWTMELGQAFIDQPKELMDTIQELRAKAKKAGTLQTTPQQIVTVTNIVVQQTNVTEVVNVTKEIVQVAPANPQVVYVPSYPPTVYYPPPTYVYNPYAPLVTFGVGMAWGAILANNCNWGHGDVDVDINRNVNRNNTVNRDGSLNSARSTAASGARASQTKWQPDQSRLSKSGSPTAANSARSAEARGWSSGGATPSTGNVGARPATGTAGARPSATPAATRPSPAATGARPSAGPTAASRPAASPSVSRPSPSPAASQPRTSPSASRPASSGSAFSGVNSGAGARATSSRGAASRGGGGRSGGGRR
jgi:hypothetical protein